MPGKYVRENIRRNLHHALPRRREPEIPLVVRHHVSGRIIERHLIKIMELVPCEDSDSFS